MHCFVVDPHAGGGAGGGEPIDAHPGEDFVIGPIISVGPIMEFFVYPC